MSDQLWILGVVLVVIGSIGNSVGTNLVSYDHHQKDIINDKVKETSPSIKCPDNLESPIDYFSLRSSIDRAKGSDEIVTTHIVTPISPDLLIGEQASNSLRSSRKSSLVESNKQNNESYFTLRNIGVTIFVIGNLLTFAAFGFAAQSLLAALESIQFVSNVGLAKYLHKEIITNRMLIATSTIILGNVLVVIFAQHSSALFSSQDIINLYLTNTAYQAYLVVAFVLWLIFHLTFLKYYNARVFEKRELPRHSLMEPLAFSVSSALIGTQAVLQAKCMSMLIQVSARGDNEFQKPTVWVLLFAWIFFVVFWLKRLDLGLKLFPPLFIIPVLQVFFIFFAILCGGIFFEEFNEFSTGQYVGFVFGVLMILTGVYGLAPLDSKKEEIIATENIDTSNNKPSIISRRSSTANKPTLISRISIDSNTNTESGQEDENNNSNNNSKHDVEIALDMAKIYV